LKSFEKVARDAEKNKLKYETEISDLKEEIEILE
jgi:hypothetical protein